MVMGVVGSGHVLSRLAPVSGVGPEELATPLKCQSWRSKKSDAAAESHWIELYWDWFAFWGCWAAWRCWLTWQAGMVGGLHGFRPGIDWEYTWQGQGHGRARRGKAAQGSWKNLYTLTWDLARAWGKGRGRKRWKVSKPISSSRVHSFECEHFTPNRLVWLFLHKTDELLHLV